jgi:hypothetical protein
MFYGIETDKDFWLSENRMALRALCQREGYEEFKIYKPAKEDLQRYREEKGLLRTRYSIVKSDYEIEDPSETEKVRVPFKHFHDPDRAWQHFNGA